MADLQKKVDELKGEWAATQVLEQRQTALITVGGLPVQQTTSPARFRLMPEA